MDYYLTHANLIVSNSILEDASLWIKDGIIEKINPQSVSGKDVEEIDLQGKMIMPGIIDLHCDAVEKEVQPRPNVYFPLDFACSQADKRNASAGITTCYHALSFAQEEFGVRNNDFAAEVAQAIHDWNQHALIDNRVHCRYEITDESALPILKNLLRNGAMHLISMMDHTPGQGQFKNLAAYRDFQMQNYQKSEAEIETFVEKKLASSSSALARMQELAEVAHQAGISVASHDDDSVERIETMTQIGGDISEFPVTLEAARAAREAGMRTVFGAPNILRGKSQSGSMKAIDAIAHGVADCLCADYSPASLLAAVFRIPEISDLDLPASVRLVTLNPAQAVQLNDRGEIAVGKRADLIAVDPSADVPQVCDVWSQGTHVYRVDYRQ